MSKTYDAKRVVVIETVMDGCGGTSRGLAIAMMHNITSST